MANTGVKGRIVDETGAGIKDLTVRAVDFDPFFNDDDLLGTGKTGADGSFLLTYAVDAYSLWKADRKPDIVVQVFGPAFSDPQLMGHRLLLETPEQSDVAEDLLDVGTLTIHRNAIDGWLVTHTTLDPENGTPVFLFPGNAITHRVDGVEMFPAVTDAARAAQTSINLMTLFFQVDSEKQPPRPDQSLISKFKSGFDPAVPPASQCEAMVEAMLADELIQQAGMKVDPPKKLVNVVTTDIPLSASDTVTEVRRFFQASRVNTNAFTKGFAVLHAKAIILDGRKAILMGSPLKQFYFSDQHHTIHDVRHRGSLMHDCNIEIEGPAVAQIDKTFATVWKATSQDLTVITPDTIPVPPNADLASVQVLRTLPGGSFRAANPGDEDLPHGETGILEAYERAIHNAEHYIYIENQYFTSPEILDALLTRMKDASRSKLQIILVLNMNPDLPGYPDQQVDFVNRLKSAAKDHGHLFGAYTVWSRQEIAHSGGPSEFPLMPIYVHSKMAIIDDTWAAVGSANLDGTSLNYHQIGLIAMGAVLDRAIAKLKLDNDFIKFLFHLFWYVFFIILETLPFNAKALLAILAVAYKLIFHFTETIDLIRETLGDVGDIPELVREAFTRTAPHALPHRAHQPPRSVELDLILYNGIAGQPPTQAIRKLRERLWTEHLGFETLPAELDAVPADPSVANWVQFWDDRADLNRQAIQNDQPNPAFAPHVLRWTGDTDAEEYLRSLKIRTKGLRSSADKFVFEDCQFEPKKPPIPWPI